MKVGSWLRVIAVNILVLAALGGVIEIAARLAYPEFRGHIHSAALTMGVSHYMSEFRGFPVRVPRPNDRPAAGKPLFVVLGDSISNGYGMAYEDIYWVRLQRLAELHGVKGLEYLAFAGYGNNLGDSAKAIESLARDKDVSIRYVLYQFNFNDITPYNREALQNSAAGEGFERQGWFRKLALWRYEYLNYSVFMRVVQHYSGTYSRRLTGTCEERGLDALGAYTWTYGSVKFKDDAETYWREFETMLAEAKHVADGAGARFFIFVSPLVFDVDRTGRHPYFNHTHLDFACATIEPRARLARIAKRLNIPVIDPAAYVRNEFEARLAENNYTPFFFTADENHFTPVTASYIAEYLEPRIFGASAR